MTTCRDVDALAAEAALGLLAGDERAVVLAHIDTCDECRVLVSELSASADELLLLAPVVEPPVGFETRVLSRMRLSTRLRRPWIAVAAAVLVLAFAGALVVTFSRSSSPTVTESGMRTANGELVGDAYVHYGEPTWVFVAVPRWTERVRGYELRVTLSNGSIVHVPGPDDPAARAGWGSTINTSGGVIRLLELVGDDGRVWCSASV